jgi:hypothetical protein
MNTKHLLPLSLLLCSSFALGMEKAPATPPQTVTYEETLSPATLKYLIESGAITPHQSPIKSPIKFETALSPATVKDLYERGVFSHMYSPSKDPKNKNPKRAQKRLISELDTTAPTNKKLCLEKLCTEELPLASIQLPKTYFSSKYDLEQIWLHYIPQIKGKIWAAFYHFNLKSMAEKWVQRKAKCTDDILIVDKESKEKYKDILDVLKKTQVPVLIPHKKKSHASMEKMHEKFLIGFDENNNAQFLIQGSANATYNANNNWDNLIVHNDPSLIKDFIEHHKEIQKYC